MPYIQVPPDQAGKKVEAATVQDGADTVYRQTVALGDVAVTGGELATLEHNSAAILTRLTNIEAGQDTTTITGPLPAGDNNIGNVDVISGPIGTAALQVQGTAALATPSVGAPVRIGAVYSNSMRDVQCDPTGILYADAVVRGNLEHGFADTGIRYPVLGGATAQQWNLSPTTVDGNARVTLIASRHGQLFVLGGHPSTYSTEYVAATAGNGFSLIGDIPAGFRAIVTMLHVRITQDTPGNVTVRIGFGTATVPAAAADHGLSGKMVFSGYTGKAGDVTVVGNGSGIIGVGAADEELRCDNSAGIVVVNTTYFIVEA